MQATIERAIDPVLSGYFGKMKETYADTPRELERLDSYRRLIEGSDEGNELSTRRSLRAFDYLVRVAIPGFMCALRQPETRTVANTLSKLEPISDAATLEAARIPLRNVMFHVGEKVMAFRTFDKFIEAQTLIRTLCGPAWVASEFAVPGEYAGGRLNCIRDDAWLCLLDACRLALNLNVETRGVQAGLYAAALKCFNDMIEMHPLTTYTE
jgi:hypothetical protein